MISEPVSSIVGAILMMLPTVPPERVQFHADIIARVCSNVGEASALSVTYARESGGDWDVERCAIDGIGGMGGYQLGVGYEKYACASPEVQAVGARKALFDKGWPNPLKAFRGYLGARGASVEAKTRLSLWTVTTARISCACCL